MNKWRYQVLGVIFIFYGLWTLVGGKILLRPEGWQYIEKDFSFFLFGTGCIFIYQAYKIKRQIYFSKCKKCKKSYTYSDLKNGICPTCNIKTIETEEYYKKYPKELDNI